MKTVQVIIVDDEAPARLNLREAVGDHSGWRVVAELNSAHNLMEKVDGHAVDVVFLDISMPGENGIDAARKILNTVDRPPYIIFVTAFDDYAIQAFELYALDYILKPFDTERFAQCVRKVDASLKNDGRTPANYLRFLNEEYLDKIVIKSAGSIRVIDTDDIFWLGTNGNYVEVHHTEGCHLHRGSLSHLEDFLDPNIFCRVHRQAIVRLDRSRELKSTSDNKHVVVLANKDRVNVSENYRNDFIKRWAG